MNNNKIIQQIEAAQLKTDLPDYAPGDTLVVQVRVAEGNRERLQAFEGVVIGKKSRAEFCFYPSKDFPRRRR
jgi:large subunit ribosomal protein L19